MSPPLESPAYNNVSGAAAKTNRGRNEKRRTIGLSFACTHSPEKRSLPCSREECAAEWNKQRERGPGASGLSAIERREREDQPSFPGIRKAASAQGSYRFLQCLLCVPSGRRPIGRRSEEDRKEGEKGRRPRCGCDIRTHDTGRRGKNSKGEEKRKTGCLLFCFYF